MLKNFWLSIRRTQRRILYFLLAGITAISLVVAIPQPGYSFSLFDLIFRGVQVFQLTNMSDTQEVQLGQQINQQLLRERRLQLYSDRQINSYVQQIGQRLVPYNSRPNLPYTFQVVRDDSVNAFATMGGFVYVTTGLIRATDNEAQLASVIGHEIGHIAGRHAVQQMRQRALASGLLSAAGLNQNAAVRIGVDLALQRPNSRADELEADSLGLEMHRAAGYAPGAVVTFMRKLQSRTSVPTFLSTHPAVPERVARLERMIDPATANVGQGLNEQAHRQMIRPVL